MVLRRKCMAIEEKTLGVNHPQYAASLNNTALILVKMASAVTLRALYHVLILLRTAAKSSNTARGCGARDSAQEAFDPAALAWNVPDNPSSQRPPTAQGELDEAIKLYKQALAIFKKVKGEASTEVATLMNHIAGLCETQVCTPACGTPALPQRGVVQIL